MNKSEEKSYTATEAVFIAAISPFLLTGIVLFDIPFWFWKSYVATKAWNWFVIGYFHLPTITILPFMGVSLAFSLFRPYDTPHKGHELDWVGWLAFKVSGPAITLLVAYILHRFTA